MTPVTAMLANIWGSWADMFRFIPFGDPYIAAISAVLGVYIIGWMAWATLHHLNER